MEPFCLKILPTAPPREPSSCKTPKCTQACSPMTSTRRPLLTICRVYTFPSYFACGCSYRNVAKAARELGLILPPAPGLRRSLKNETLGERGVSSGDARGVTLPARRPVGRTRNAFHVFHKHHADVKGLVSRCVCLLNS